MTIRFLVLMTVVCLQAAEAQEAPPAPVLYTPAREHEIRNTVRMPGTLEARIESPVASEVEGYVTKILAREGTAVDVGTPLAQVRTTNLELSKRAAASELKEAEARYDLAQRVLKRAEELKSDDLISQNEFDDARAEFVAWEGRVEKLQADLERISLDLERCTIRSPIAGVVVKKRCDIGSWIRVGDSVCDVLSTRDLEVRAEVPDRYYSQVKKGTSVTVSLDSYPPVQLSGTVSAVIPKANTLSRVFPLKIRVADPQGKGVAGMTAEVALPVGELQKVLVVPKDALVAQGPMSVVYVLGDDGSATSVSVTSGQAAGAWVSIRGEVKPGDKVIVRGNERIFPGQVFQGELLEYDLP